MAEARQRQPMTKQNEERQSHLASANDDSVMVQSSMVPPVTNTNEENPKGLASANDDPVELLNLTLKQRLFTEYYIGECYGNGTEAARRAGYSGSDNALAQMARDNLRNTHIMAYVKSRLRAITADSDAVLRELWRVASAPMNTFMVVTKPATFDEDGTKLDHMHVRLDYSSKVRALELVMRYNRMLEEKAPVDITIKALVGVDISRI